MSARASSDMLLCMWRAKILGWTDQATFNDPGSEEAIRACEVVLVRRCLVSSPIFFETATASRASGLGLIWPIERIRDDNLTFRATAEFAALYMPFEPLLFFADAGNGDQFAFVMRDRPPDVFVWDHETDSRTMVAPSLAT